MGGDDDKARASVTIGAIDLWDETAILSKQWSHTPRPKGSRTFFCAIWYPQISQRGILTDVQETNFGFFFFFVLHWAGFISWTAFTLRVTCSTETIRKRRRKGTSHRDGPGCTCPWTRSLGSTSRARSASRSTETPENSNRQRGDRVSHEKRQWPRHSFLSCISKLCEFWVCHYRPENSQDLTYT